MRSSEEFRLEERDRSKKILLSPVRVVLHLAPQLLIEWAIFELKKLAAT